MTKVPYASAMGLIMYAIVCSRPDLAYASSLVSRFMSNPGKGHWNAVKWVLRYIKGIVSYGLLYKSRSQIDDPLIGFCDSNFCAYLDKRRSLTGYGNVISWKSSLQYVVALSTTEAEFMALTEAIKEALWLLSLAKEFGVKQETVPIYSDSQSAIHFAKNQGFHEVPNILM